MAVRAGSASAWRRGCLLGEVAHFPTGPRAKFFLEDTGQVTGLLDLASAVRAIPEDLARAAEGPQAVNLVIRGHCRFHNSHLGTFIIIIIFSIFMPSGIAPVTRSVPLDMWLSGDVVCPAVARDWSGSAARMVRDLLGAADADHRGSSVVTMTVRDREAPRRFSGDLSVRLSPGAATAAARSPALRIYGKQLARGKQVGAVSNTSSA